MMTTTPRPRGRPKGSKNKSPSREGGKYEKSAAALAKQLDVSVATIERVRAVLHSGEEDIIERLMSGELAANTALKMVRQRRWMREMSGCESAPALVPEVPAEETVLVPRVELHRLENIEAWAQGQGTAREQAGEVEPPTFSAREIEQLRRQFERESPYGRGMPFSSTLVQLAQAATVRMEAFRAWDSCHSIQDWESADRTFRDVIAWIEQVRTERRIHAWKGAQ